MSKRLIPWVLITTVLIIVVLLTLILLYNYKSDGKCNYNNPTKSYIKKEKACVINFLCTRDKEAFSDACGCGCKDVLIANASVPSCDFNDTTKGYIKKQPCVINFLCIQQKQAFSDECGCGCKDRNS